MQSEREMKIIKDSGVDIDRLIQLKSNLPPLVFMKLSFLYFSKYLENKKIIPQILSSGNYTYELSIIWEMENETWFTHSLKFFLSHAHNAFKKNRSEFIKCIESHYPSIHEALENYHDTCFLYNINCKLQNREIVRGYFRMMGDTIESTHYLLLQFIYDTLTLSNSSPIYNRNRDISHGKMIAELLNIEYFDVLLNKNLNNIPLNQWRNISQHSSYKYNKTTEEIILSYGKNSSAHIKIYELEKVMVKLNILQKWLKIAFEFTYLEFIDSIDIHKEELKITNESLLSQLGNILPLNGYSVLGIDKILN
ncbi:hypothetical protein FLQ72_005101, partial [Salmonella enterica]|nr:hypothetical protein [Salmonella enterica]EIU5651204.1 hypothetical protein [Salmonella enterica]